ncbi:hypothetical protein EH228_12340 [Erwinia endophytica]|uniref:hypothetical protein n=1 Tax=Erwinia endophytica TaxID=1563158 RepID=UPI001265E860|nr:hypothetical protein [Erwinia endophytica]KAB8309957.1 hypothetical protein EH228_12340 [Erwinia endophytica]
MIKKDWCSWTGIVLGAIALILALTHFMTGPFTPHPSLESLVAEKTVAIKHAAISALQGKEIITTPLPRAWDIDRIISAVVAVFAASSILLGALGGLLRKENKHAAITAVLLGIGTVALQFAIMAFGVVLLIVLITGVVSALTG